MSKEFCRNISTATYGYDELDRLTSVLDPENKLMEIHYGYRDGQLKSMTDPRNNTSQYTYSTAGHLEKFINPLGEVKEISNTKPDGSIVAKYIYQYDAAGNRTVEEICKEDKYYKREYSYYRNNTVKSMVETGDSNISINYQYDEAGNISEKVEIKDGVEERYTYEYNEANRMVTETDVNGVRRSYRYDLNGNRTQRVISDEVEAEEKEVIDFFYYNHEDQLEEMVLHNGKVFTYGYDGEGNRLWRTHAQYPLVKPPTNILNPIIRGIICPYNDDC